MKFKFDLKSDAKKIEKHLDTLQDKSLKKQMKTIIGGEQSLGDGLEWSNFGWVNNWKNNWNNGGWL